MPRRRRPSRPPRTTDETDSLLKRVLRLTLISKADMLTINRKLDRIVTDLSGLQAAADQIGTDVQEAIAALDELKEQVGAGESVSQEDIDAITEKLRSAGESLDSAVASDDPEGDDVPAEPQPEPTEPA